MSQPGPQLPFLGAGGASALRVAGVWQARAVQREAESHSLQMLPPGVSLQEPVRGLCFRETPVWKGSPTWRPPSLHCSWAGERP